MGAQENTVSFRRRHLPHWMVAERAYFATVRLKGSLPAAVSTALKEERIRFLNTKPSVEQADAFERSRFLRIDQILDACSEGPDYLADPTIARLVFESFDWLERNKGWLIHALTVMQNHLHVLLRNTCGKNDSLGQHLGLLKGFTAREANKKLGRTGRSFWMDENFDHWCRTEPHMIKAARYIAMNPVKAGLVRTWSDWPWTRVHPDLLEDLR